MKHFYSHALMLLVQLPDKAVSYRMMEREIDTKAMDRHLSRSEVSVRRPPTSQ
jgi:hypothetical protein